MFNMLGRNFQLVIFLYHLLVLLVKYVINSPTQIAINLSQCPNGKIMKLHHRLNRPQAKARTNKKGTEKCTVSRGRHQHQRQDKSRYNPEVKAERYTSTAANQINNCVSQRSQRIDGQPNDLPLILKQTKQLRITIN